MTGLFTSEYIVEKPRVAVPDRDQPADQSRYAFGAVMNVDLCAALHAAMRRRGRRRTRSRLDSGEERIFVQFPAEWLRNPQSPWLRRHPVDVPWDDPELLDAMLALRNER